MHTSFASTLRSLRSERSAWTVLGPLLAVVLLAAWCAWFALAPVNVYAQTSSGRLEADGAPRQVAALSAGRLSAVRVALEQTVRAGDVLFELASEGARLELDEARARLPALEARRAALEREALTERERSVSLAQSGRAELGETSAWIHQAEASASTALDEARRFEHLQAQGLVADADVLRLSNRASGEVSQTEALRLRSERLELELEQRLGEVRGRLERLEGERAAIDGELATARATVERLTHEVDELCVRAPCEGRVGALTSKRAGGVVEEREELAVIVPPGELLIVAEFDVADAAGRLAAGQEARLRLDGFPWSHYGSLRARVVSVATEPAAGRVRVELAPTAPEDFSVALRHGMTGSVEIAVEQLSPALLVLRSVGTWLDRGQGAGR